MDIFELIVTVSLSGFINGIFYTISAYLTNKKLIEYIKNRNGKTKK